MTNIKTMLASTAAAVGLLAIATPASAATVVNGSFEDGLNGWTVTNIHGVTPGIGITTVTTNGVVDSTGYGDVIPAKDGTHAAFFVDDLAIQGLSQQISLIGGRQYTLNYSLFATQSGANNFWGFALSSPFDLHINAPFLGTDVAVGSWTDFSYNFSVQNSGNYDLTFGFLSGPTPAKDVLLDAVSIAGGVPEPSTWALMILGFGLIGGALRRKQRQTVQYNFA